MVDAWTITGTILSGVGVAISIGGFIYTLNRVEAVKTAATATSEALKSFTHRMRYNFLSVSLHDLRAHVVDLEHSLDTNDQKGTINSLKSFSRVSVQIITLLEDSGEVSHAKFVRNLKSARTASDRAKGNLSSTQYAEPLNIAFNSTLTQLYRVSVEASGLITEILGRVE